MTFDEVLEQVRELLQSKGRVAYRALKRRFELDDEYLEDLKAELIDAEHVAHDEDGKVLVWRGSAMVGSSSQLLAPQTAGSESRTPHSSSSQTLDVQHEAERRQLTVMFCDLVGSTALSTQLDPEELREVILAYRETCASVIHRFDGYLAKYIGDGLLVYFGYPVAHEDDAQRAVRVGLGIINALQELSVPRVRLSRPLQVRIGIHTGLVVAGEMGVADQPEPLAIVGETPNVAARIQGLAEANTVIVSAVTHRLIDGTFECQPFGAHLLKGIDTPLAVYHVQGEQQGATPLAGRTLTPLVGREQEVSLLLDRWEQAKEGRGQVILLSGEPGIGKSRLAYTLREHVTNAGSLLFEARCSPYHQQSALYPLIDVMQRTLLLTRYDTDSEKVKTLERALALYNLQESLPLFTALLSLPPPSHYPALTLTPQKQKERTLQALTQLFVAQAGRQATVSVWEDLHWADPSSLEFLSLLLEQIPTTKLLLVLTFRPEFTPGWKPRSHLSQLVLNRLGKRQVETMITQVTAEQPLPAAVVEQIITKTDGVPLFVEELTKSVVEAVGATHASPLQLTIPATLQEALLARLDRLSSARQIAQLGATLGREFSYELLRAVAPVNETELPSALAKLVEAEILYPRGVGEQARYFFKHALIQDMAYQSLLKSTRQQLHQQIAHTLEEQFPEAKETQPELLAHHYTAAGLIAQAIPYWQQAGQRASQRGANAEAVSHLTTGLELLQTLPDTPQRIQLELTLQLALGALLTATKGFAAPEVEHAYRRARTLCEQIGDREQVFTALRGLTLYYAMRAEHRTACELADQLLVIAQETQDPALLIEAHHRQGGTRLWVGEFLAARASLEQAIALYDPQRHRTHALRYGADPGVACRLLAHQVLWILGYPDQALMRAQEAFTLAQGFSHVNTLGYGLACLPAIHYNRGEWQAAQARAEACVAFATEVGLPYFVAQMSIYWGAALAAQGHYEEGITKMRQGLAAQRTTGGQGLVQKWLALQVEAYIATRQTEEGWIAVEEALTIRPKYGDRYWEADLYRLKGELLLAQEGSRLQTVGFREKAEEAEAYFQQAIETARELSAKSFELRAATSLARLWQQQGKKKEAHEMLAAVYSWFTEGFDTKDLQDAKRLIEELS